jgi:hypothetical protein
LCSCIDRTAYPEQREEREDGIRIPSQHIVDLGGGIEPSKREKIHEQVKHHSAGFEGLRATPTRSGDGNVGRWESVYDHLFAQPLTRLSSYVV